MTQSTTLMHSSRITTPILDRWPHQLVRFILQLPDNISILILEKSCALPSLSLSLHLCPTQAFMSICPPCPLKYPFQDPLKNPTFFSRLINLTIQSKTLHQFHTLHQLTLPEMNPLTFQERLQLSYQQINLHQVLLIPQNSTLLVELPQACLTISSAKKRTHLTSYIRTKFPLSQWIPSNIPMVDLISDPPYTPSNSTSGYPYPLPPKQTPAKPTHIVSPNQ